MKVLVVAEHLRGDVLEATGELVAAAKSIGGTVSLVVIGDNPEGLAAQANFSGVDEILAIPCPAAEFDSDVYRQALEAAIAEVGPDAVFMGFSVNSIGYGAAVAAKLGLGFASDVFAIRSEGDDLVVERSYYGGKLTGELAFPGKSLVLLQLRRGTWEPAARAGAPATRSLEVAFAASRTRHVEFKEQPSAGEVDITTADFILCVGRGVGEQDNLERFQQLADRLGATFAVSRPIVDAGWAPRARQVGQSGKTVKPKVYLSFGVSGAVQHLAGMKTSGLIISINTDPEASIFGVAHYGATVDMFALADALEQRV